MFKGKDRGKKDCWVVHSPEKQTATFFKRFHDTASEKAFDSNHEIILALCDKIEALEAKLKPKEERKFEPYEVCYNGC